MAEIGILSFNPEDAALRSIVFYRDELSLIVPPNHPLASSRSVHIQQLGAEYFVAHNVSSPYRQKVLETFKRKKVPLNMDVEMPTIDAIKRFVARGNGVALLPSIAIQAEVERGELVRVPVKELNFERKLRMVHRKGANLSHAAKTFLSIAEQFAREHQGAYMFQADR
jgi:DNA-binding transcriptional LysR family regulator